MARKSKSVYERIEEQQVKIREAEEVLVQLNNELQELNLEKDDLEMKLLLEAMKSKGLNINEALAKMSDEAMQIDNAKSAKAKQKTV